MNSIKDYTSKAMSNPIGAIAGGVLAYYIIKKHTGISNKWAMYGLTVVGVFLGATIQNNMKAKASAPTKEIVQN
jgi:hypothetical protein